MLRNFNEFDYDEIKHLKNTNVYLQLYLYNALRQNKKLNNKNYIYSNILYGILNEYKLKIKKLNIEIITLKDNIKILQQKLKQKEDELEQLKEDIDKLNEEKKTLEEEYKDKLEKLKKENEDELEKLKQKEDELEQLKEDIDKLNEEKKTLEEEYKDKLEKLKLKEDELEQLKIEYKKEKEELEILKTKNDELEKLKTEKDDELEQLKTEYKKEKEKLEKKTQDLAQKNQGLEEKNNELEEEKQTLETENVKLIKIKEEKEKELTLKNKELEEKDGKLKELEEENETLKGLNVKKQTEILLYIDKEKNHIKLLINFLKGIFDKLYDIIYLEKNKIEFNDIITKYNDKIKDIFLYINRNKINNIIDNNFLIFILKLITFKYLYYKMNDEFTIFKKYYSIDDIKNIDFTFFEDDKSEINFKKLIELLRYILLCYNNENKEYKDKYVCIVNKTINIEVSEIIKNIKEQKNLVLILKNICKMFIAFNTFDTLLDCFREINPEYVVTDYKLKENYEKILENTDSIIKYLETQKEQAGGNNEEYYKQKYLKYKIKYNNLKNNKQN